MGCKLLLRPSVDKPLGRVALLSTRCPRERSRGLPLVSTSGSGKKRSAVAQKAVHHPGLLWHGAVGPTRRCSWALLKHVETHPNDVPLANGHLKQQRLVPRQSDNVDGSHQNVCVFALVGPARVSTTYVATHSGEKQCAA